MQVQGALDGREVLASLGDASASKLGRIAEIALRDKTTEANEEAAKQFEAYFATMLVREMKKAIPEGFFSGAGSDVYGSWFDQFIGQSLAERDSLGIAGMIKTELARSAAAEIDTENLKSTEEEAEEK